MIAKPRFARSISLCAAVLAAATSLGGATAKAATINLGSLETVLVDPDDYNSMHVALWTGWMTQLYEYNMPFIELANDSDAPAAIERFTMTIGDERYQFSNIFNNKDFTNSYPFPADGSYAITGFSTPDVPVSSSVADGGDTLVVEFGNGGLQPGETVRFQVDIDRDSADEGANVFGDYTSVFFQANGGPDHSGNSMITLDFVGLEQQSTLTLPNFAISGDVAQFLQTPRPYSIMQTITPLPTTPFEEIPEPTTGILALAAAAGVASRRRV